MTRTRTAPPPRRGLGRRAALLAPLALLAAAFAKTPITEQGVFLGALTDPTKIPPGYRTYTLFVSTTYDYAKLAGAATTTQLLAARAPGFGKAIGDRDAAILIAGPDGQWNVAAGRTILEGVNTRYGLKLSPQDGPYILVLQRRPGDPRQAGDKAAAIALRGQTAAQIRQTLDELERELKAQRKALPADRTFESFWTAVRDGWLRASTGSVRALSIIWVS